MTLLANQLKLLAQKVEELELSIPPIPPTPTPPTPTPTPPTPTPPTPIPTPTPTPPTPIPSSVNLTNMIVNPSSLVIFEMWSPQFSRYTRAQGILRLTGKTAKIRIYGHNNGAMKPLTGGTYTLFIDGNSSGTVTPLVSATSAEFIVDSDALALGWHELRVEAANPGETCIPYFALVVRNGISTGSNWIPVATASYSLAMDSKYPNSWSGKVPATYNPTKLPLPARERVSFSTMIPPAELHVEHLVPMRPGDTYRVCKTVDGALTTFANQPYHWSTLISKIPYVPLLDGPRGVGTVTMATHVEVGTAAPPGIGFINNTYFCDPWRVGKVRADGTVITLVGYRHKDGIVSHWQDKTPNIELVGDWSSIPVERRGFWELWGMAWDRRRDGINNVGDPSPDPRERGLIPHPPGGGMVIFLADSQHNRIVRCEFPHDTHFDYNRTKVTEFLINLADPWDCVGGTDGILYVSERKAHRICAYSMDTGELLRVVVQGEPLATIGVTDREVRRTVTLDIARAAICVAPEGLYLQDGWLYWGSKAQAQVKRVHLETGTIEVVYNIYTDDNTKFAKIAVSDGSFLPRGTVGVSSWTARDLGWPQFSYEGTGYGIGNPSYLEKLAGQNSHFTYPTSVGFGGAQLLVGGVNEGMLRVTKRLPTDTNITAAAKAGITEWFEGGYNLLHGHTGFGFLGLPLPWGVSSNIDAFLLHHGHKNQA